MSGKCADRVLGHYELAEIDIDPDLTDLAREAMEEIRRVRKTTAR